MFPRRIDATLNLWNKQLPTVKPFYAVKCNPEPVFLNYLYDKHIGFDCASERELLSIRSLARVPITDRIVYANPCKSVRDIAAAKQVGSPTTVVDSVEEVEKLAEQGYTGKALVRLAVDDSGSDMPFSSKFGAAPADIGKISFAAYKHLIHLDGFSFHVGSGCGSAVMYRKAMKTCLANYEYLWKFGHDAYTLDIGGGFVANTNDFMMKALSIRSALEDIQELPKGPREFSVIAEPGRFFAANSFDFFVQVIGKKGSAAGWKYTIDDSIYGQFSNILFDQAKPLWTRVTGNVDLKRRNAPGVLFGRTCDSLDVIARCDSMEELFVGDWLRFPSMGAYTRATASEFNGFPTPEVVVITDTVVEEPSTSLARRVVHPPSISVRDFYKAQMPQNNAELRDFYQQKVKN
jgi:ornithine decarboxylase